jgi:hypothetical protein
LQSADAGADEGTDVVGIGLGEIETGILERLPGGVDSELGIAVGAAGFLRRRKRGSGVEILDLRSDLRVERGGVKGRDFFDAAFAGDEVIPENVHAVSEGCHDTETGNDDSALCRGAGHKIRKAA